MNSLAAKSIGYQCPKVRMNENKYISFPLPSPAEGRSGFHSEDELREYAEIHKLSDNRVIFMNLFLIISYVSNVTSVNFDAYSCILSLSNDAINPFLNFGASAV